MLWAKPPAGTISDLSALSIQEGLGDPGVAFVSAATREPPTSYECFRGQGEVDLHSWTKAADE
jgi:hypothetical protein